MQIGFVGLGRMGGNMVHRIHRDSDHEVVAFDFDSDAVSEAEGHGATGVGSLEELVASSDAPRAVWIMVPAGDPPSRRSTSWPSCCDHGDLIVDGGNSKWTDDERRGARPWPSRASTSSTSASAAASGACRSATA